MEAWYEIIKILVHLFLHASREVTNYTASQLCTVIVFILKSIFNVVSNLGDINVVTYSNNQALESNEAVLSNSFSLLEKLNDDLDDICSQWFLNKMTNFNQNNLKQPTK